MKKTIVIYQHPKARGDIFTWANKKRLPLDKHFIEWHVSLPEEHIHIIPSDAIHHSMSCDKLVLFGQFTKENISLINKMKIGGK
jgi:hypothetical protein